MRSVLSKLLWCLLMCLCCKTVSGQQSLFLYPIVVEEKAGFIDIDGKVIVPPIYYAATEFNNGFGIVFTDHRNMALVNTNGKIIRIFDNPDQLVGTEYKHFFSEGLFATYELATKKYGFIDSAGKWIIAPKYYVVKDFSNGLAAVIEDPDIHVDTGSGCGTPVPHEKWGFIDHAGNYVITPRYHEVTSFQNNYAVADGKIIDKNANVVNPTTVKDKSILCQRIIQMERMDSDSLFFIYPSAFSVFSLEENNTIEGYIPFTSKISRSSGYINYKGDIVISPIYKQAQYFRQGLAAVSVDNKNWGFIDTNGKVAIESIFSFALPFYEGVAAVVLNDKWGFIDKTGKLVINPQFDNSQGKFDEYIKFHGGLAQVTYNGKMSYVNKKGKIVWRQP